MYNLCLLISQVLRQFPLRLDKPIPMKFEIYQRNGTFRSLARAKSRNIQSQIRPLPQKMA